MEICIYRKLLKNMPTSMLQKRCRLVPTISKMYGFIFLYALYDSKNLDIFQALLLILYL